MYYLLAKFVCSETTGRMNTRTIHNVTRNFVIRGLRGNSGHTTLTDQAASTMEHFGVLREATTHVDAVSLV